VIAGIALIAEGRAHAGKERAANRPAVEITAWGFASAFGPLLIAYMRQSSGSYRGALHVIAGVLLVSVLLPLVISPPRASAA
jgi:hypothetical protein